jgi:hypothetical protein
MPHSKGVIECLKIGKNEKKIPRDTHHMGGKKRKKCKVCVLRNKMPIPWPRRRHFSFQNNHCNKKGVAHKVLYVI